MTMDWYPPFPGKDYQIGQLALMHTPVIQKPVMTPAEKRIARSEALRLLRLATRKPHPIREHTT